jgi:hypothetical protein
MLEYVMLKSVAVAGEGMRGSPVASVQARWADGASNMDMGQGAPGARDIVADITAGQIGRSR